MLHKQTGGMNFVMADAGNGGARGGGGPLRFSNMTVAKLFTLSRFTSLIPVISYTA